MANGQRAGSGSDFRQQLIWRKAQDFASDVVRATRALPHDRATDALANQLLRSATSIAANIAEGYGRFSQAAYRNHLSIARGSAFESESWIDLLARENLLAEDRAASLLAACVEIQKLVTYRMKSLDEGKSYAVREEDVPYEV